ncbi:MAG: D-2-hydroxyacid dehydrogenase family protein [Alphaproteobacteria bacterium]|nr:D-2-hydroxyacid dehydrogenase family protein [Alphaproteobacteria bacterium]
MKHIVILDDYQNAALSMAPWDRLAGRASIKVINRYIGDRDELVSELASAQAIICNRERTPVDASLIAALPKLELIVTSGHRNNSIDVKAAAARNVTVCGTATLGYPTAELTVGMMLAFFRHLPLEFNNLRSGRWQTTIGRGARGRTLGIVGYGRIGKDVAKAGLALGMNVLAWSRSLTAEKAAESGVAAASLEEVLKGSDVVSIHLAANAQTRGMIGAREFNIIKPGALFINTARAMLADQDAMLAALKSGQLGGVALDVYDIEPLPMDHPLLSAPNTLLTPHLGYVMKENYRLSFGEALENVEAWLNGAPIRIIAPYRDGG